MHVIFQKGNNYDYEQSELLLYQNMVIQESGDLKQALIHLESCEEQIVDKLTLKEMLGDLNLKLKQFEKSAKYYEDLIRRNPENTIYYNKLIDARELTNSELIVNLYSDFEKLYPKAMPPKRLPLNYATGDQFKMLVDKYLRKGLTKGVPPLFVDLRSLYNDPKKIEIIEQLLLQYVDALTKIGKFNEAEINNGPKEPASALLWVYYFLAQHFDFLKDTKKALSYINAAIDHTPTLIELFVTKGRVYKVNCAFSSLKLINLQNYIIL
jgi:N-alpha-acetyltransferase 15/16, NatA auxiliary subunit